MAEEEQKRGPGRPPKVQTVACEVLRDYWPTEDGRVRAGTIVDLDPVDAIDKIEAGMVRKAK